MFLPIDQVSGDQFNLARTDSRHFAAPGEQAAPSQSRSFDRLLLDGLQDVSSLQQQHQNLAVQAIVRPDEVNAHDVTIAAAKASTALNLAKGVVDRVVQAYRDITNVR
jgi:flagellar hook-basal body complex protein FliE